MITAMAGQPPGLKMLLALLAGVTALGLADAGTRQVYAAESKHAALVVDANTGTILHSDKATEPRFPASLTKMMTLYMVFELIEDNKLTYDTKITASREAASRPPSRIGLKPGDQITVRQAVHALITKSANDVAAAVAEHIAGSETAFAQLMTRKARQLGMRDTVFRNASGLPDAQQITTARDMAQLALRLRDHFPNHFWNFKTRTFHYKGRRFRNHNVLLGRFRGVDGIKTGYTRASGFNLVTSVRRSGKYVVAVVMGGKTGRQRNAQMRELLDEYLPQASLARTRRPDLRIPARPPAPQLLARRSAPVRVAAPRGPSTSDGALRAPQPRQIRPGTWPQHPQPTAQRGQPPGTLQAQAARLSQAAPSSASARHRTGQPQLGAQIQVGAFSTVAEARRQLERVQTKAGPLLAGAQPVAIRAVSHNREIYRARYAGFAMDQAAATCKAMQRIGIDCFVDRTN
jgi:D-alanyl-D-alanine carboxypeptidase